MRGVFLTDSGFQNQGDVVHAQDIGNFIAQRAQEVLEFDGLQQAQDGAVHLIGACEVFVGRCDDRAVRVLEPVQPRFEPLHGDAAQVDDVVAARLFVGGHQRLHQILVVQHGVRLGQNRGAEIVLEFGDCCSCPVRSFFVGRLITRKPGFALGKMHAKVDFICVMCWNGSRLQACPDQKIRFCSWAGRGA